MKQTGNYHEGYIDGVDSRLGEIQNLKDEIESLTTKLKQESECVDFMKETTDNYEKEIERLKDAMQLFCTRVDNGEVRSTKTYSQFKELLTNQ